MQEEYKERFDYIKEQVEHCLKSSNEGLVEARKHHDTETEEKESRSVLEYKTVLSIIKNSESKERREYDKEH